MYSRGVESNSKSSSGIEEQTSEMISNLTMTQLLFILQRIQQLTFHSPEYAKTLLTESPQLSLALIHAQYLVAGKGMESHLLPLTADEVKIVKDRIEQIRQCEGSLTIDPAALVGVGTVVNRDVGLSRKVQGQQQASDQVTELTTLLTDLDPQMLEKVMEGVMGGDEVVDLASMVQTLLNLSAEQIASLPESVQRQVLKLLEQSLAV